MIHIFEYVSSLCLFAFSAVISFRSSMGLYQFNFFCAEGFAPSFANLPTVKINSKIIQKYKKIRFVNFYGPDSDTDCREDGGHLLLLRLLPMMVGTSPWLGSLLLIAARIYQKVFHKCFLSL